MAVRLLVPLPLAVLEKKGLTEGSVDGELSVVGEREGVPDVLDEELPLTAVADVLGVEEAVGEELAGTDVLGVKVASRDCVADTEKATLPVADELPVADAVGVALAGTVALDVGDAVNDGAEDVERVALPVTVELAGDEEALPVGKALAL